MIKKAQKTISRPCTICGKLILKGQYFQDMPNVGSYKHLTCINNKICQCTEPEFRWFMEDEKWTGSLVCLKCSRPKYKKDL